MVKNLPANAGDSRDVGSRSVSGRSPGKENGNPLQYSCLENPMDRGAWWCIGLGITKNRTRLSTCAHTHSLAGRNAGILQKLLEAFRVQAEDSS